MDDIHVSSNWVNDPNKLKNIISYISSESKECSMENVTTESCVCLTQEGDDVESKPELEINSKDLINQVDVLSEGSLIEVFGFHNEYLLTCECDFIDDWEGMAVYHGKIILPEISKCRLKFTRLKKKSRLWIYSVQLGIIKAEDSLISNPFNFETVNKLIDNSSQPNSEKLEKFKNFLEMYKRSGAQSRKEEGQSFNQAFNLQLLLSLVSRECSPRFQNTRANASRSSNNLNMYNRMGFEENLGLNRINRNELSMQISSDILGQLKIYIDDKLEKMKEDILKQFEDNLNSLREEQNAKLDSIAEMLKNMKL